MISNFVLYVIVFYQLLCCLAAICISWMVSHGYMCLGGQYMWTSTVERKRIRDQDTVHEIHISANTKHSKENTTT